MSGGPDGRGSSNVDVLQLTAAAGTIIFHLSHFRGMPAQLLTLLDDRKGTKVGENIGGDKAKLLTSYGPHFQATLELKRLAEDRQLVADRVIGPAALT